VQKKAAERLLALEHPALDVFQRVLEADEATLSIGPWQRRPGEPTSFATSSKGYETR
jgi:hypothetical protein